MSDIFVSYARADRARAELIVRALESDGFAVWWDPNIEPGNPSFHRSIEGALEVYAGCFPTKRHARLLKLVKDTADALSEARDLDVQIDFLTGFATRAPHDHRPGISGTPLERPRLTPTTANRHWTHRPLRAITSCHTLRSDRKLPPRHELAAAELNPTDPSSLRPDRPPAGAGNP